MAHGILENDTMFSVKEKPWHKLGTVVETAPTVREAIRLAGLDWKVELRPICTNDSDNFAIDSHRAVVKEGTSSILGVVGQSYHPLQNTEAFEWFEPFLENDFATLELEPARKTWNMYNAVNSYLCHDRCRNAELRQNSIWFGDSKLLDRKAFELARKMYAY